MPGAIDPAQVPPMPLAEVFTVTDRVLDQVGRAVVGKREALRLVLAAILAGGHVLLEDNPGLGKTLAARSFAQALGLDFRRVQFTPDLLPADVTGSFLYDQRQREFVFRPGSLFAGLLLADEVNRTPPKTQSALLEAMQEGQTTVEGHTFPLPRPFHVLATASSRAPGSRPPRQASSAGSRPGAPATGRAGHPPGRPQRARLARRE